MSKKKPRFGFWQPDARQLSQLCTRCYRKPLWRDDTGLPWCHEHRNSALLMDAGLVFNWPAVTCFPYVIQAGWQQWKFVAGIGKNEYIEALLVAVGAREEEVAA